MDKSRYVQKILFGGPGTGKSYRIIEDIIPYELDIDEDETPENVIKTVFHPEYTYGDFMGKLVPLTKGGKVEYKFYEGSFLKALTQAYKNIIKYYGNNKEKIIKNKEKVINYKDVENVVLVIDELNRGNSSAIFGSTFQLLDREEDGWSSYGVNINEIEFLKILELIGIKEHYSRTFRIEGYTLPPLYSNNDNYFSLEELSKKSLFKNKSLDFNLVNRVIKIPPNLSILATMNASNSSVYYMDSAFKRRWEWEFINIDGKPIQKEGIAFKKREDWKNFVRKLNQFIKSNYKYIRGIEDKQIGYYFITDKNIKKSSIQNKLMFFIWDNVFARDKKPLVELLYGKKYDENKILITFGDFAKEVDLFMAKIKNIT